MKIQGGYPCRLCGHMMQDTTEGRGFTAGANLRFVACNACAPKVEVAARATVKVVQTGLSALIATRAPGLMPILKQLRDAYVSAKQETN